MCHDASVLECVVNISEGTDDALVDRFAVACGDDLLDVHRDAHHNRSVFTLVGTDAPRRLATTVVERLDLHTHTGVHPRIGVVDVVPFVPLEGSTSADALAARDAFARWAADELALPCFLYGPERSLPEVRREAFTTLDPDVGPAEPHITAGACAVGARDPLIAYNVWVEAPDLTAVRRVARAVRGPGVRTLGLAVGDRFQVSCNLIDPGRVGPDTVTASVERFGAAEGIRVVGCELVGLLPRRVLDRIDETDWARLDLGPERTIEARLAVRRVRRRTDGGPQEPV